MDLERVEKLIETVGKVKSFLELIFVGKFDRYVVYASSFYREVRHEK